MFKQILPRCRWVLAPAIAGLLVIGGCAAAATTVAPTAAPAAPTQSAAAPTPAPTAAPNPTTAPTAAPSPTVAAAAAAQPTTAAANASGTTVVVRDDAKLGMIVTDDGGMTLYKYAKDSAGASVCTGGCAKAWPPFASSSDLKLPDGVAGTLALISRSDGGKQVTYNGVPLYHFAKDAKPGDTTGQGVGGVWSVVAPGSSTSAGGVAPAQTSGGSGY